MRFLVLAVVASATLLACESPAPESADPGAPAISSESELSRASGECVIDTLFVKKGFIADLAAAVDPSFVKDYGPGYYKHVLIPRTLDAALGGGEYGEAFYTLHGFDFYPEEVAAGSSAKPRFVATVEGGPEADTKLTLSKKRAAAAKAIFEALTRAVETTENHVVPPAHVYDRSWTKVTRTSPGGRLACVKTTYPNDPTVLHSCTVFEVERNMVQNYNSKDAACLTR